MKKLLTILFFTVTMFAHGQQDKNIVKEVESKITEMKYVANSVKELENIDWKKIKAVFDANKLEEKIALIFELELQQSKNNLKSSITISGETKNIDSLIIKAKKGVTSIIKISKKYKNK
tara:strand:+ start:110 stop:466 length:357 start_codon:yes stop_codon:yes gene_type:complete